MVWELEQGPVVHQQYELPSPAAGIDAPDRLDAFLDAVRWGAIASADKTALQAPFRSGAEIQDYQLAPLVRALSMPRTNLLIADDVGLGKTIEADLVMQELMLRHRARTMLIVCPSGLTLQWQDEMRDKFGLDFRIVNSALLRELRRTHGPYTNPWTHYPRLLTTAHLGDWGLPTESAAHIVAELAANAVLHGRIPGRDFQLSLAVHDDRLLRIAVTDTLGERLPLLAPPAAYAESGRPADRRGARGPLGRGRRARPAQDGLGRTRPRTVTAATGSRKPTTRWAATRCPTTHKALKNLEKLPSPPQPDPAPLPSLARVT